MTMGELWRRMRFMIGQRRFDQDLREEIRLHLELRAERLHQAGLPHNDAIHAAHRRFGNVAIRDGRPARLHEIRWAYVDRKPWREMTPVAPGRSRSRSECDVSHRRWSLAPQLCEADDR